MERAFKAALRGLWAGALPRRLPRSHVLETGDGGPHTVSGLASLRELRWGLAGRAPGWRWMVSLDLTGFFQSRDDFMVQESSGSRESGVRWSGFSSCSPADELPSPGSGGGGHFP